MILLTVGDSWTQGDSPAQDINWEAKQNIEWYHIPPHFGLSYVDEKNFSESILNKFYDSDVWPKVLGRNLGLETYNAGRLGLNNKDIVKSTIKSIKYIVDNHNIEPNKIFVVIGFTSKYRDHLIKFDDNKKKYTIDRFNYGSLKKDMFKQFSFNFFKDEFCLQIYSLQKWLEELGIKFIFFNAFEDQNDVKESSFFNLNLKYWYNNSLDSHFKVYIEKKYKTDWSGKKNDTYFKINHPTDLSHVDWGNNLAEYIKNKKLI